MELACGGAIVHEATSWEPCVPSFPPRVTAHLPEPVSARTLGTAFAWGRRHSLLQLTDLFRSATQAVRQSLERVVLLSLGLLRFEHRLLQSMLVHD
jgi:hypothetical protein